jgi:uncharacterized protein (DUF3084 family)
VATSVTALKVDLQEHKLKLEKSNQDKTKMEVELMQSKVELSRAESEVRIMQEWVKEQEHTIKQHSHDAQEAIEEDLESQICNTESRIHELTEELEILELAEELISNDIKILQRKGEEKVDDSEENSEEDYSENSEDDSDSNLVKSESKFFLLGNLLSALSFSPEVILLIILILILILSLLILTKAL